MCIRDSLQSVGAIHLRLLAVVDYTGVMIVAVAFAFLLYVVLFGGLTAIEKRRVGVIAVCFWAGYEQAGSSMNLFAERLTDRMIGGWEMPASWLQSVNALFIILFAPVFSALRLALGSRSPSIPGKMALGLMQLGVGFAVVAWASVYASADHAVRPGWLVAA